MEAQNTNITLTDPYYNEATVRDFFDRPSEQWHSIEATTLYTELTEQGLRAGPETPEHNLYLQMMAIRNERRLVEAEKFVAIQDRLAATERWRARCDTVRHWLGAVGIGQRR